MNKRFELDGKIVKLCPKCQEIKPIEAFSSQPSRCRVCISEVSKTTRENRTPEKRARDLAKSRLHRQTNPDYYRQYEIDHKEKRNARKRERFATDISFRLRRNAACAIHAALKREMKAGKTLELLGCSIDAFRDHITKQFTEGMSWDKMGSGPGQIQLDHALPCVLFDLSIPSHQRACFHYTNIQPLWSRDNESKVDKLDDGRRASDLTPDERRSYLIHKGFGHLFDDSRLQPECYSEMSHGANHSRQKPVRRDDGVVFPSLSAAGRAQGSQSNIIALAIERNRPTKGHSFEYVKEPPA